MKLRRVLAVGGLAAVAACSDNISSPDAHPNSEPSASVQQTDELQSPPIRIMKMRSSLALSPNDNANDQAKVGAATANSGIFYHGGPIIPLPKVVAIYWGTGTQAGGAIFQGGPAPGTNGFGTGDNSLVGYFLNNLGSSPYWAINYTYTDGSGNRVAKSLGYSKFWAPGVECSAPTSSPTDANMQALIDCGIRAGKIAADLSTVYAIFTPSGINLGGGFGSQYCAYHSWYTSSAAGGVVKYAAMPYNAQYPSGCVGQSGSPNGDYAADAEVNTLAHELEEAATDALGTAWYDRRGYENADKCAWKWGTTFASGGGVANMTVGSRNFLVQQNWKNVSGGGCFLN